MISCRKECIEVFLGGADAPPNLPPRLEIKRRAATARLSRTAAARFGGTTVTTGANSLRTCAQTSTQARISATTSIPKPGRAVGASLATPNKDLITFRCAVFWVGATCVAPTQRKDFLEGLRPSKPPATKAVSWSDCVPPNLPPPKLFLGATAPLQTCRQSHCSATASLQNSCRAGEGEYYFTHCSAYATEAREAEEHFCAAGCRELRPGERRRSAVGPGAGLTVPV